MSHELPQETIDAIRAAIFHRQKIQAIKLYREATATGLKESKDFIETLTERLYEESPDEFAAAKSSGCAGAILTIFGLSAGILWTARVLAS